MMVSPKKLLKKLRPTKQKKDVPTRRRRLSDSDASRHDTDARQSRTYRRAQMFSGSSSASVKATETTGGHIQSPRAKMHHLRRRRRTYGLLLASSITAACGTVWVLSQAMSTVDVTVRSDKQYVSRSEDVRYYASILEEYLAERPLQRFAFSFDKNRFLSYAESRSVYEVRSVSQIKTTGFMKTNVTLQLRTGVASWQSGGQERYVDKYGITFNRNVGSTPVLSIVDESGMSDETRAAVASGRFLVFAGRIVAAMNNEGIQVESVRIPAETTRKIGLKLVGGGVVYFSIDRSIGEQTEDAVQAVRYIQKKGYAYTYIDVRAAGKAFFK